jgi:hypothetical protein
MQCSTRSSSEAVDRIHDDLQRAADREKTGDAYRALAKSSQIILRSAPAWSAAVYGLAWMTAEEAFDAARIRLSCKTVGSWAALERDLAPRMLADTFARFCLLMTSAIQIGEEAGYPLERWLTVQVEKLAPTFRA